MSTRTVTRTATYQFDLLSDPFAEGDTLTAYAERRLAELGVVGQITKIDAWREISEVELRTARGACSYGATVTGEFVSATVKEGLTVPS